MAVLAVDTSTLVPSEAWSGLRTFETYSKWKLGSRKTISKVEHVKIAVKRRDMYVTNILALPVGLHPYFSLVTV